MKHIKNIAIIFFGFMCINLTAQRYSFEEISDKSLKFQTLDSTATLGYLTDSVNLPLGFDFNFYNKTSNSVTITKSGHFKFKSNSLNIGEFIMGNYGLFNGMYLYDDTLFYKFKTTGEVGNRIFTYECVDLGFYFITYFCPQETGEDCMYYSEFSLNIDSAGAYSYVKSFCNSSVCGYLRFSDKYNINFQIKIYENSGKIELQYGNRFYPLQTYTIIKITDNSADITCLSGTQNEVRVKHDKPLYNLEYIFPLELLFGYNIYTFYPDNTDRILYNDNINANSSLIGEKDILSGAIPGNNIRLDRGWAEKYYISQPVLIKGIASQNFGSSFSCDSAVFSIYSVGNDQMPGKLLNQKKAAYKCLDLNNKLNYIVFDSVTKIDEPFFVSFELSPYNENFEDTIGLNYFQIANDSSFWQKFDFGRAAFRGFNNKWYDVYASSYFSNSDSLSNLIHFSLAPIVNYDTTKLNTTVNGLQCNTQCENTTAVNNKSDLPQSIITAYPNPANDNINIELQLNYSSGIEVTILGISGEIIEILNQNDIYIGRNRFQLNTTSYSSGFYLCKVQTNMEVMTVSFIIQK